MYLIIPTSASQWNVNIIDAKCSFNKLSLIKNAVKLIYQNNKVPFEGSLFQLFKVFIFSTGCIFLHNWVKKKQFVQNYYIP